MYLANAELTSETGLSKLDLVLNDTWSYFSDGKCLLHGDSFDISYVRKQTLRSLILHISISAINCTGTTLGERKGNGLHLVVPAEE